LKHELEFEAKLERSIKPVAKDLGVDTEPSTTPEEEARRTSTRATAGSRPVVTGATQAVAAAQTGRRRQSIQHRAPEYIFTEIEHHKRGALVCWRC